MDFSWPSEYLAFKKEVTAFAEENLNGDVISRDQEGNFPMALWKKCADFGIQGLSVPQAYGGREEAVDFMRAMLAMEGLGYGCKDNGLALALNAQMWTVQLPIHYFGTEEQRHKYLTPMVKGEAIGAHALTEPNAGSDIYSMETTAKQVDGGYLLNGEKRLITCAPIAKYALVFAKSNPKLGKWGISAFIVEKGMEGFRADPVQQKMGLRTVPIGQLKFDNCFVPQENLLGKEGNGFSIMNHTLEYDRCCILASQLGAMDRQLKSTIAYAKKRKQFGQAIGHFQSVSNRIADMRLRLETCRLLLYKVAWMKSQGKSAILEAALLKLHLGESFITSSMDAIRTHGGIGFLTEFEVERDLRDAVGGVLYAGTSDIQRNIIAKMLGL